MRWKDQTIFAGEDVECTITFKNVAETSSDPNHGEQPSHQRRQSRPATAHSESLFSLKSPFSQSRRAYPTSPSKKPFHRISSSLSSPWFGSHSFPPPSTPSTPRNGPPPSHKHKRSVSILSIDSEGPGEKAAGPAVPFNRPKPARGHGRSASVQVPPRRIEGFEDSFGKGIFTVRCGKGLLQLTVFSWAKSRSRSSTYQVTPPAISWDPNCEQ